MLKLYNTPLSGNCYKVRLMLAFLAVPHQLVPVNLKEREQKTADFLKLNPLGEVPVLQDGDTLIRDSQAILVYLAKKFGGAAWFPDDAASAAKVVQWLSVSANEIWHGLAAARLHWFFGRGDVDAGVATARAHALLQMIDAHLASRAWLELDRPTIADVACYPYISLAHEGKIALDEYQNVVQWMDRFKRLPGFVSQLGEG